MAKELLDVRGIHRLIPRPWEWTVVNPDLAVANADFSNVKETGDNEIDQPKPYNKEKERKKRRSQIAICSNESGSPNMEMHHFTTMAFQNTEAASVSQIQGVYQVLRIMKASSSSLIRSPFDFGSRISMQSLKSSKLAKLKRKMIYPHIIPKGFFPETSG